MSNSDNMIEFDVKYYHHGDYSHKYPEKWAETDLFCPECGNQTVYVEQSGGDYYVGVEYLCAGCGASFFLPTGVNISDNEQDKQRLVHIRANRDA